MEKSWQSPKILLILMAIVMPLAFSTWNGLLNNFAKEVVNFTGKEMGMLQSLREIPGFLAFTAVFVLLALKEQTFALLSLTILCIGVAITGFFPTVYAFYATTVFMSIGFHYFETMRTSLILQWLGKDEAPAFMGRLISIGSLTSLITFGLIWLALNILTVEYKWIYLLSGCLGLCIIVCLKLFFPTYEGNVPQHKKLFLRKRYWLFYCLTFMSGARRQIFVAFAGFLLVTKFNYAAQDIILLFIANHILNFFFAPKIGALVGKIGEKRALSIEYIGLIFIFVGYALVDDSSYAAILYILDHLFFAMAIAIKTYFQKIADPADIASTAGVSFTINHIAAVIIPVIFGYIWLNNPAIVFILGAVMAAVSLLLSQWVPVKPGQGIEVSLGILRRKSG